MQFEFPEITHSVCKRIHQAGGLGLVVGGAVRDTLMGLSPESFKDIDIEVHGLNTEQLETIVQDLNPKAVGKAFGVVTLDQRLTDGVSVDLNLPRKDNKMGDGHKGFEVEFITGYRRDMSENELLKLIEECALRRDLTMNTPAYNVLDSKLYDPFNGHKDIMDKILRATDPHKWAEDPLRGLRVAQFASRFEFEVDALLKQLARVASASSSELPKERKFEEWFKMLTKGTKPSIGLEFMRDTGWLGEFPQLTNQIGVLQNPDHHPEGDVWNHMMYVVDAMAQVRHLVPEKWFVAFCFAVMLHDVGKVKMTVTDKHVESGIGPDGKPLKENQGLYTAYGHDIYGTVPGLEFMQLLTNDKKLIEMTLKIIRWHMAPYELRDANLPAFKRLAREVPLNVISYMSLCDHCGRPHRGPGDPDLDAKYSNNCMEKFHEIGPEPIKSLLMGRDLIQAGIKPGPVFKTALDAAYEAQMDDDTLSKAELLSVAVLATIPKEI